MLVVSRCCYLVAKFVNNAKANNLSYLRPSKCCYLVAKFSNGFLFWGGENEKYKKQSSTFDNPSEWGYDLYPERKGAYSRTFSGVLSGTQGNEAYERLKCEKMVYKCFKTSKLVQLMAGALNASGCKIDLARHVVCEVCDPTVNGGYDPELNQIVICQNSTKTEGIVQGILTHEMIHMFDYCNNNLDFTNIDHLACTEIRAANLTHCSFASAMFQGDATPWDFKNRHQNCVKTKAIRSILAVRKVSTKEAIEAIERVFSRCYRDLEPIGRRVKANSNDAKRAYAEGFIHGYI